MNDCIFCKIIKKEIPSKVIYEDENVLVFEDINPQAPIHLLLITKRHYNNFVSMVNDGVNDTKLILEAVMKAIKIKEIDKKGFRLVINNGKEAGQAVDHIHIHILSGRKMNWPPG